jgi:hypothetical protein
MDFYGIAWVFALNQRKFLFFHEAMHKKRDICGYPVLFFVYTQFYQVLYENKNLSLQGEDMKACHAEAIARHVSRNW